MINIKQVSYSKLCVYSQSVNTSHYFIHNHNHNHENLFQVDSLMANNS